MSTGSNNILATLRPFVLLALTLQAVCGFLPSFFHQDNNHKILSPLLALKHDNTAANGTVTLEYAHSFRRHVVRSNNIVVQSFLWLDEAVAAFPDAQLLPVEPLPVPSTSLLANSTNSSRMELMVAGEGGKDDTTYPRRVSCNFDVTNNKRQIQAIFQTQLQWFPSQVQDLFKHWPDLAFYPSQELAERIRFLLAPLPDPAVLDQVNYTQDIDWAVQFYTHGRGAGMSVAQASHALSILPQYILRLPQIPTPPAAAKLSWLYTQTPAVVLEMTGSRLDAWLAGTSTAEMAVWAYLHWKGWEWTQCRVLLHAWPSLLQPALEAGWEIYERGQNIRKLLLPTALYYMQTRLQLRPWHLQAMFKTHPRLTGYSVDLIQRSMDCLQESLQLSSVQLRRLLLRLPSLLGCSVDRIAERIRFWRDRVGLSVEQLQKCALEHPALLQYGVSSNLEPKLHFFKNELEVDAQSLVKITSRYPVVWGYSLQDKLRLTALCLTRRLGNMTLSEFGTIIVQAPAILLYNWKTNLSIKLDLLQQSLDLSNDELKTMVQSTPHVLFQGLKSLQTKIGLMEAVAGFEKHAAVRENPSLLLNTVDILRHRLENVNHQKTGSYRRSKRSVALLSKDEQVVEMEFQGVSDAARYAGISVSNMYHVIRNDRLLRGRKYVYRSTTSCETAATTKRNEGSVSKNSMTMKRDSRRVDALESSPDAARLTMFVSGYAFPPEGDVRGRHRSGGMALHVPNWSINEWRGPCSTIWKGQKLRLLSDGRTVILGYAYTRPSRPRCSLYVCREAIRVATLWLASISAESAVVEIRTDSNYAFELLQNTTKVLEWGRAKTRDEFTYTGPGPLYKANPDILYPVARSLYHLVQQDQNTAPDSQKTNVSVCFLPAESSTYCPNTRDGAKLAAELMYERVR